MALRYWVIEGNAILIEWRVISVAMSWKLPSKTQISRQIAFVMLPLPLCCPNGRRVLSTALLCRDGSDVMSSGYCFTWQPSCFGLPALQAMDCGSTLRYASCLRTTLLAPTNLTIPHNAYKAVPCCLLYNKIKFSSFWTASKSTIYEHPRMSIHLSRIYWYCEKRYSATYRQTAIRNW